jgi:hypothetical protein
MSGRSGGKRKQDDPLYERLKKYHDELIKTLSNATTEKLSDEVSEILVNPTLTSDSNRKFLWSHEEQDGLNQLNVECKKIQAWQDWTWAAPDQSPQGIYNDKRMQFCVTEECWFRIIECPECQSTGILVDLDQIEATVCYDCVQLRIMTSQQEKKKKADAWNEVRPKSKQYPKRTEKGHEKEDLPALQPGDNAVIAPVLPVVTVKKQYYADKKLRKESISLVQDCGPTW